MLSKKTIWTGSTTGSCAQAAAKASAIMLLTGKIIELVSIITPSGINLNMNLIDQKIGNNFAGCGVVKRSGEDNDVTHGAKIYAEVRHSGKKGITIKGGEGIGVVTKPGLAVGVGEYAINPVPRRMITKEVNDSLLSKAGYRDTYCRNGKHRGVEITISVPEGKKLARRTFNPQLGINGGISIIGTSGISRPKSIDAYKASLSLQLDMIKAAGHKDVVLVLGYVGEKFCKGALKAAAHSLLVKIGDHVGFMLEECVKKDIKDILLIGHIGKLSKVAGGQFNTHIRFGDNRIKTITRYAKLCGAKSGTVRMISGQVTAEAAIAVLRKNGLMKAFNLLARDVSLKGEELTNGNVRLNCILLSLKGKVIGAYPKEYKTINHIKGTKSAAKNKNAKKAEKTDRKPVSKNKICIIGIGPGTPDYLPPISKKRIKEADCLIGGKRNLDLFKNIDKEKIALTGDFDKIISFIRKNRKNRKIAVLLSGDPGLYGFLGKISHTLKKEEYEVIPGISAIQLAFARIGETWEDACILSLHGRRINNLAKKIRAHNTIALFTDANSPPQKIAGYLIKNGLKNRRVIVFENLSYPDEKILDTRPETLNKMDGFGLCVMIIKK